MALAAPVLDQTYRYPYQTLADAGAAPPVEAGAALDRFAASGGQAGRLARSIPSRG